MLHRGLVLAGTFGDHAVLEIKLGIEKRRLIPRGERSGHVHGIEGLAPTLEVPEQLGLIKRQVRKSGEFLAGT